MLKALDALWEWGTPIDRDNQQILTCNLYGKKMMGGACKLKYHLALISGHDVGSCPNTTPKLILQAKQAIEDTGQKKQFKEAMRKEIA